MIWNIITDSSCDIKRLEYKDENNEIRFFSVPFIISAKGKDFVDDENIDLDEMIDAMENDDKASHTSCPSPAAWLELFEQEGNVLAVTISKELSGSYNSAMSAVKMLHETQPDKSITLINSCSAGSGLAVIVREICQKIAEGRTFEEVSESAQKAADDMRTIFALCSFGNLVKNGRMSPFIGFVAKKLGFWGIGVASNIGTIVIKGKVRGAKKGAAEIIKDMEEWGKPISFVAISHCQNEEMANQLKEEIVAHFGNITVEIEDTKGLCSYYAERHGLIMAYK